MDRTARYFTSAVCAVVLGIGCIAVPCLARTVSGAPSQTVAMSPDSSAVEDSGAGRLVLTVGDCRNLALQNNVKVRNASLDVLAAKAQKGEAFAEYFPKVSINAFGYYAFDPMLEIGVKDILGDSDMANNINSIVEQVARAYGIDPVYSTMKQGYSATVSVMQPVFAGGRIVYGNRLAALGVEAAGLQNSLQQRKSVEEVEKDYWQVVSLEEKMKTVQSVRKMLDNLEKDVDAAVDAGLATETDRLQLQLKQNEMRATQSRLKGGIRLAKMNLCNAIGVEYTPYSTIGADSLPYIDSIEFADDLSRLEEPSFYWKDESEIVVSREESRLLDISVKAKQMERRMVLGEVLPQVGVGVSYGYNDLMFSDARFNGAVYATLQIPITDWGKYSRKMQRYDYQLQKARNEKDYLDAQLLLQVRQQWLDLTVSWEQAKVAEESVSAAESVVRQMEDRYRAGLVPVSELLEAQTALQQSADALVDARIAYRNAVAAYAGE